MPLETAPRFEDTVPEETPAHELLCRLKEAASDDDWFDINFGTQHDETDRQFLTERGVCIYTYRGQLGCFVKGSTLKVVGPATDHVLLGIITEPPSVENPLLDSTNFSFWGHNGTHVIMRRVEPDDEISAKLSSTKPSFVSDSETL